MLALSLDAALNIGLAVIVGLIVLAVLAAWLVKSLVTKLVLMAALGLLAFAVWSNRATLQDCADNVTNNVTTGASADVECSFYGFTVTIPIPTS